MRCGKELLSSQLFENVSAEKMSLNATTEGSQSIMSRYASHFENTFCKTTL